MHELYRILYLRAEAQAKADAEKKKKEEEEAKRKERENRPKGYPPGYRQRPADVKTQQQGPDMPTPSPYEAEVLEDTLEELAEGGVM